MEVGEFHDGDGGWMEVKQCNGYAVVMNNLCDHIIYQQDDVYIDMIV